VAPQSEMAAALRGLEKSTCPTRCETCDRRRAALGECSEWINSKRLAIYEPRLSFDCAAWDVTTTTRSNYEAEARAAFERQLRFYCNLLEEDARRARFEQTPEKRNPDHYRWLARNYCLGETPAHLWRSLLRNPKRRHPDEPTRRAVEKAIHDTARVLGLSLHKPKKMRT
jgi:hypothetical protein